MLLNLVPSEPELDLVLKRFYFLWAWNIAKQSVGKPLNNLKGLVDRDHHCWNLMEMIRKSCMGMRPCHFLARIHVIFFFFFSFVALSDLLFSFRLVTQQMLLGESSHGGQVEFPRWNAISKITFITMDRIFLRVWRYKSYNTDYNFSAEKLYIINFKVFGE